MPSQLTPDPILELIYSIRALAQTLDIVHEDLKKNSETCSREHDQTVQKMQQILTELQVLPITTSERLEKVMDKRIDGVLEDVRKNLNEVRNKLWNYLQAKKIEEDRMLRSTPIQGVPILANASSSPAEVSKTPALNDDGIRISWSTLRKIWGISKWVIAALAAGGGITALIDVLLRAFR